jgi:hypothetical protein
VTPVLVWEEERGKTQSVVETDQQYGWTPEEFRAQAEALDEILDHVLDEALKYVHRYQESSESAEFLRAWAVGRTLNDSGVAESEYMRNERPERLWRALSSKCRLGLRSDGRVQPEWRKLRPGARGTPRREGGRLDYFEMCRWLAQQQYEDAKTLFGGSVRNVWQMLERPTLRPPVLRSALLEWMKSLAPEQLEALHERTAFALMMKRLRRRWPDRGPGSAKRPAHYDAKELRDELATLLQPLLHEAKEMGR